MKIVNGILQEIEEKDIIDGKLIIPEGVISIESNGCLNERKVISIYFPKSLKKIGEYALASRAYLENVYFQEGIEEIAEGAFVNCFSLKNINFPKSLKKIGNIAFKKCKSIKHITLEEGLKEIEPSAFSYCEGLEEIKIPSSVEKIGNSILSNCQSLKKVILPENLEEIPNGIFLGCLSLANISIPLTVKKIGASSFRECTNISNLVLPEGLEIIGEGAFYNCRQLESIEIPNSVISIHESAFGFCSELRSMKLPKSLSTIEKGVFQNCYSLSDIEIPESIRKIGKDALKYCRNLNHIYLPLNLQKIEEGAFYGRSLKNVTIPGSVEIVEKDAFARNDFLQKVIIEEGVKSIGRDAFYNCSDLKYIKLPNTLEEIGETAFGYCAKLKEIEIPKKIKRIESKVFYNCSSLTKVFLHEDISFIKEDAFNHCPSLKELITPWGKVSIENIENNRKVEIAYLYLYANHILKNKYKNIDEFMENPSIADYFSNDNSNDFENISKFKNLFYKLRREYNIDSNLLHFLNKKTTEEFNYSIWKEIKDIFPWQSDSGMKKAFAEMIEVFGLFHKDKNQKNRIQQFKSLFYEFPFKLTEENFNILRIENAWHFTMIEDSFQEEKEKCLRIDKEIPIPEEFSFYLKDILLEKDRKRIKKESGTFGKRLNDFVDAHYRKDEIVLYSLKEEYCFDQRIRNILFHTRLEGHISASGIHQIFDGCSELFNEDFYNFFMKNLDKILEDEMVQSYIREINKKFTAIQDYYLMESGTKNVSLKQTLDYIEGHRLDYRKGNCFLAKEANKAGVVSQDAFDYYQDIYERNRQRRLYSLIRRSNIYEVDGYIIKAELLRKDDPLTMLIGEKNYTNCCQVYGGIGHNCMAHASSSIDGGIFVTRLLYDGNWILLTQSWDWQNNNLYCHDNIEGTKYLKNGPESLKRAVAEVYKKDAKFIIEESKKKVENYINKKREMLQKSKSKISQEELTKLDKLSKSQTIKVVTSGCGYDDLGLENYINNKISINNIRMEGKRYSLSNFQPANYNSSEIYFDSYYSAYSDARDGQYILAGNLKELTTEKEKAILPIYRDERKLEIITKDKISDRQIKKISEIENQAYPVKMKNYQEMNYDDFLDSTIYLGEDWYLIYENQENGNIYISDLARTNPSIEDERGVQQKEIMKTLFHLINSSNEIEADLKEDTSYLLYLMNQKLGYIEQIGEDIVFSYESELKKVVTEEEQEKQLKDRKINQKTEKQEILMHNVKFKKRER